VGNICSLTDPIELIPYLRNNNIVFVLIGVTKTNAYQINLILLSYLGLLIPVLKSIVIDPIPEVHTVLSQWALV
jgi:hypothetical protein